VSTKTHDDLIKEAVRWAKSLGYGVVEYHLGTETGADAIFENQFKEYIVLEVVTGANFKGLFKKPRIKGKFITPKQWIKEFLGLIIVGDRVENVTKHGIEAGIPTKYFDPPEQRIFPVLVKDFEKVIPVLLVSLLGARASAYGRLA